MNLNREEIARRRLNGTTCDLLDDVPQSESMFSWITIAMDALGGLQSSVLGVGVVTDAQIPRTAFETRIKHENSSIYQFDTWRMGCPPMRGANSLI